MVAISAFSEIKRRTGRMFPSLVLQSSGGEKTKLLRHTEGRSPYTRHSPSLPKNTQLRS